MAAPPCYMKGHEGREARAQGLGNRGASRRVGAIREGIRYGHEGEAQADAG